MNVPLTLCVSRTTWHVCVLQKLSPSTTAVSSVMTPNPDGGHPSMTVIEALQQVNINILNNIAVGNCSANTDG